MDTVFCPTCHAPRDWRVERRTETYPVRGEPIWVEADVAVCAACGGDVSVPALDDEALGRAYDEYRKRHGIIHPEGIRQLRERYGLSQRAFARLLGWSPIQIHRYETGALPDSAHSDLLTALQREETMGDYVLEHGSRLTAKERQAVLDALQARMDKRGDGMIRHGLELKVNARPIIERGFRDFELDRMRQMVVLFTSDGGTVRTALLKKLFYADFLTFKRYSKSLSGSPYLAYQYGPVPYMFNALLGFLEDEGTIMGIQSEYETIEGKKTGTLYQACIPFDPSLFDEDELGVLYEISDRFAGRRAKDMVQRSHGEDAWLQTGHQDVIPYSRAETLTID